jgi:hypothetical protein
VNRQRETHPTTEVRQALCARRDLTINSNPARISGARNDFATVTDMTTRMSCEWAWGSAFLVANTSKAFKS